MKHFIQAAALLLALLQSVHADDAPKLPAKENVHVYLLVGQSNMAGRGTVEEQDKQPHPRVLMLTKDLNWAPAVDPLHFDKPGIVGVGLGKTFGIEMANANPDVVIGLIPCAVGGSPIDTWQPGGFHSQTNSHPWDDMLPRAKAALEVGTLKGILWHQGESDCTAQLAPAYKAKLHELIARFRKELNAPDVPFIAGQMGQFRQRPWDDNKKLVDAAHQSLPQDVPHTAFVNSNELGSNNDYIHFNSAACRELGKRYAAAMLNLASP